MEDRHVLKGLVLGPLYQARGPLRGSDDIPRLTDTSDGLRFQSSEHQGLDANVDVP